LPAFGQMLHCWDQTMALALQRKDQIGLPPNCLSPVSARVFCVVGSTTRGTFPLTKSSYDNVAQKIQMRCVATPLGFAVGGQDVTDELLDVRVGFSAPFSDFLVVSVLSRMHLQGRTKRRSDSSHLLWPRLFGFFPCFSSRSVPSSRKDWFFMNKLGMFGGKAWSATLQTKSVAAIVCVWQFMQPVRMFSLFKRLKRGVREAR